MGEPPQVNAPIQSRVPSDVHRVTTADSRPCCCSRCVPEDGSEEAVTRHIEEEMLVESVLPIRLQDCGRFHRDGECPPLPRG